MGYKQSILDNLGPDTKIVAIDGRPVAEFEVAVMPLAREADEQKSFVLAAKVLAAEYSDLDLLHHIPNGEYRPGATAAKLSDMGVKAGVPDFFLPVARGEFHGLYIELKRQRGGKLSGKQSEMIERLRSNGYCVQVCHGAREAVDATIIYLQTGEEYHGAG